jgi:hypothetical protein
MKYDYPMYEGDGIIRSPTIPEVEGRPTSAPSQLESAGKTAFAGPYVDICEIERRARQARAETVGGLFARLFNWLDARVQRANYRELERYLGESTDLADLERRIRRIEGERRNLFAAG